MDKTTYFLSLSRLAPVQAVWWGNADTSGVHAMDYRLVSEYEHENFRDHYTEKELYQFKYVHRPCVSMDVCIPGGAKTQLSCYLPRSVHCRGMGIFHSFPKPHDYNASREHVRDAITKRFKLRKDFHMYLSIEVHAILLFILAGPFSRRENQLPLSFLLVSPTVHSPYPPRF